MVFGHPGWEEFTADHVLSEDVVHVWRIGLKMASVDLAKLRRVLSQDERKRADRFRFETDRRRAMIGRGYLRLLLGEILKLPADGLRFEHDDLGKPRLTTIQGADVQFNVSHSGELILIAITIGRAVGVDVERIRIDFDVSEVATRFFSVRERRVLDSLAGHAKSEAFYRFWTLKEAYLKARGVGLSAPLDQFDVTFLSDDEPSQLAEWPDRVGAGVWTLRPLSVSPDYAAALAAAGSGWKLKCWRTPLQLLLDLTD